MSSNEVATKPTGKAATLYSMLSNYRPQIVMALPQHVSPDRMLRMAMTSARKNPQLLECTPESFLGAVIQSAQLGLEPDTPLGHCYLIPFMNNKTGKREVQFMPGYRGLMDLVYRAPNAPILMPRAVYDCDEFKYVLGLSPQMSHAPGLRDYHRHKLTHVYCTASFVDGRREFLVMDRSEIDAIKARSKSSTGPWKTDYEPMALKTVIRRLVKYMPMSAEISLAVGLDEKVEAGESQNNEDWIKVDRPIQTKAERIESKMTQDPDPESFENFKE